MAAGKAQNKTQLEPKHKVKDFVSAVESEQRRDDAFALLEIMRECTSLEPQMWGTSIVGFGTYHYKYESGGEGDMPVVGFSPRKQDLTLYLVPYYENRPAFADALKRLGKHKTGKACYTSKSSRI